MTAPKVGWLALLCLCAACHKSKPGASERPAALDTPTPAPSIAMATTSPKAPAAAAAPTAPPPATAATIAPLKLDPTRAPSFGEPAWAAIEPPMPPLVRGMMDHASRSGWLADSTEFGYCTVGGGTGNTSCGFITRDGKRTEASDLDQKAGEPDPKKTEELRARSARYAARTARWRFARDLVLTFTVVEASEAPSTTAPQKGRQAHAELRVGARVRDATRAALPIVIDAGENATTIHPEAILVSPDGTTLAVLSHAFGGEYSDHFELRLIATNDLASQAYNVAGLDLHARGEFARAAELFHLASYANPTAALPPYNLACALARLAAPEAEPALRLAIQRGGAPIKSKAERDHDFDAVRGAPWFTAIVR